MSNKLMKMRAEREKNEKKINTLRSRNADLNKQITELENLEIVGVVREVGMTPEELAFFLQDLNGNKEEKAEVQDRAE